MRKVFSLLGISIGIALAAAGGVFVYRLAMPDAFIENGLMLLVVLAAQVLVGGISGFLVHSWRALAVVPAAYIAGFLAEAVFNGGSSAQVASIAGGVYALALVFVLAELCSVLALGTGIGTLGGVRMAKHLAYRRQVRRRRRLADQLARSERASTLPVYPSRERELAGAR
jgi:uncharacterized membrane protein YGL010W